MRLFFILGILLTAAIPLKAEKIQFSCDRRMTPDRTRMYLNAICALKKAGSDHLREADDLCFYLPDHCERTIISGAIMSTASALQSGSLARAAFAMTIGTVMTYIAACYSTYDEILDHLKNAEKCFEMAESLTAEVARKEQDPRWLQ